MVFSRGPCASVTCSCFSGFLGPCGFWPPVGGRRSCPDRPVAYRATLPRACHSPIFVFPTGRPTSGRLGKTKISARWSAVRPACLFSFFPRLGACKLRVRERGKNRKTVRIQQPCKAGQVSKTVFYPLLSRKNFCFSFPARISSGQEKKKRPPVGQSLSAQPAQQNKIVFYPVLSFRHHSLFIRPHRAGPVGRAAADLPGPSLALPSRVRSSVRSLPLSSARSLALQRLHRSSVCRLPRPDPRHPG